jgi:ferredoxin-NADP reductase
VARLVERRPETPTATTLVLDVPGWPGHLPGQHIDLRLTAEDGYRAQRSYSIASATDGERFELTVQQVPDGEVSSYLVDGFTVGDPVEVRGPVGGWFVWQPAEPGPVLLVGGGSGVVPLMSMLRARAAAGSPAPFHLVYSTRTPQDVYYAAELDRRTATDPGLSVALVYTRRAPPGYPRAPGRIAAGDLAVAGWTPSRSPSDGHAPAAAPATTCYVCGPTGFVEAVADTLVALGHDPGQVRTERFGPTGGGAP